MNPVVDDECLSNESMRYLDTSPGTCLNNQQYALLHVSALGTVKSRRSVYPKPSSLCGEQQALVESWENMSCQKICTLGIIGYVKALLSQFGMIQMRGFFRKASFPRDSECAYMLIWIYVRIHDTCFGLLTFSFASCHMYEFCPTPTTQKGSQHHFGSFKPLSIVYIHTQKLIDSSCSCLYTHDCRHRLPSVPYLLNRRENTESQNRCCLLL